VAPLLRGAIGKAGEQLAGFDRRGGRNRSGVTRMPPVRAMSSQQRRKLWVALAAYAGVTLVLLAQLIWL
jgi:hypothetical protein